MRTLYLLVVIYIGALLTSCTEINAEKPVDTMGKQATSANVIPQPPKSEPQIPKPGCAPLKKKPEKKQGTDTTDTSAPAADTTTNTETTTPAAAPATTPAPAAPAATTPSTTPAPNTSSSAKDPQAVAFFQKGNQVKHHYKVIGKSSVSKFNDAGVKRQEAVIRDNLRNVAAAMGGDAVIEIKRNNHIVTGAIVSFEGEDNKTNA